MVKYNSRSEVERIGTAGAYFNGEKARVLSSFWMFLDPQDDGFTPCAKRDGYWEAWITYWMSVNAPPTGVCIDVGANHGYYSFLLATEGHKVIAVEPQASLCAIIEKSAHENNLDIRVDCNVIGDKTGKVKLIVPKRHGMNATISSRDSYSPNGNETLEVNSLRLDDYCEGKNYYSFMKIDAEGAEELIWNGGVKFREENPDCLYLMEWRWDNFENPERFGKTLLDSMVVTHVDYDGKEYPISSVEGLKAREHEDWMLVLRKKS